MDSNLNINLIQWFHSIASNTNSNRYRESFPYELDKLQPKSLQRDEVVMEVMMVLMVEMMMMMIPMKSSSMAVTMASISPSGREFPPVDSCLPESFSLSGVFRPAEAAESFSGCPPDLRFP